METYLLEQVKEKGIVKIINEYISQLNHFTRNLPYLIEIRNINKNLTNKFYSGSGIFTSFCTCGNYTTTQFNWKIKRIDCVCLYPKRIYLI